MKESEFLEDQPQLITKVKLIPSFSLFDDKKIEELLRFCKIRIYDEGEVIIREGDREQCMYFMFSGHVQVAKDGKMFTQFRRTGDIFGEMGLLDDEPRSATIRALKETTCLVVDAQQLSKFEPDEYGVFHAAMYKMFAQSLTHRLRVTTQDYLKVKNELEQIKNLAS